MRLPSSPGDGRDSFNVKLTVGEHGDTRRGDALGPQTGSTTAAVVSDRSPLPEHGEQGAADRGQVGTGQVPDGRGAGRSTARRRGAADRHPPGGRLPSRRMAASAAFNT
ncbi:unnamed protein product [Phytophthora lilii]|uniref:Unnamed protein product n=1 Tax=Phytophthora lilii TaxID=2077276 RepID=A0A9W6TZ11_9STRA|nr:unnamed protein product [Phytophthora lilii]